MIFKNKRNNFLFFMTFYTLIFSIIYYLLDLYSDTNHFEYNSIKNKNKTNYINKLYYAITAQTTLGLGDIYPITKTAQIISALQTFITFILLSEHII